MASATRTSNMGELFPDLLAQSEVVILDFSQIPDDLPDYKNIKQFFARCEAEGVNPRLAEQRQKFNDNFLHQSGKRYLIGRYGEDRIAMLKGSKIAQEGRSIHLGLDIFTQDLEPLYAPCDGEVVDVGRQKGSFTFGYYLIFKPSNPLIKEYIFLGHLSRKLPPLGKVTAGDQIATLGDYVEGENGGWSRHVHVQLLTHLPEPGTQPRGYSTKQDMDRYLTEFPDPTPIILK
ncbi:peptidoglycan DD-metalloendopeptidase family protein [Patescibacteria group bacterium]|nr:peptidoglycan DD-metalloendopeptidase family protein [Patescibacteria group bacterium]